MDQPSDYRSATTGYYDAHVTEFCERTAALDVSPLYPAFLQLIPPGGSILDAGSGSGRDSAEFLRRGFRVVSMDGSIEMVKATASRTGQEALLLRFDQVEFRDQFDGIWACGSLVHVARRDLSDVLGRLTRALRPEGVLYVSFKYGDAERWEEERFFNDMNEARLQAAVDELRGATVHSLWTTDDLRNVKGGWLNALVRRA